MSDCGDGVCVLMYTGHSDYRRLAGVEIKITFDLEVSVEPKLFS